MPNQSVPLDRLFQALADPTRRGMVERLSRGPASISELARPLAMSLPAVMQHLQVLESSGLVRSEKAGRVRTCRIEPVALRTAEHWIAERRTRPAPARRRGGEHSPAVQQEKGAHAGLECVDLPAGRSLEREVYAIPVLG